MRMMIDCGNRYIQKSGIKDLALLKICLCAIGIMIGLLIPENKKKWPLAAAGVVFIFSYFLLMAEFIKIVMEVKKEK